MENEILETIENETSVEVFTESAPEVVSEAPVEEEKPKRRRRRKTNVEAETAAEFDIAVAAEEAPAPVVEIAEEKSEEPIVEEQPKEKPKAAKKPAKATTGAKTLNKVAWLYPTSVAKKTTKTISGEVYLWNPEEFDGRVRVCKSEAGAGVMSALLGWVDVADID